MVNHRQLAGTYHEAAHSIHIAPNTLLRQFGGADEAYANSDHHQAIDRLGCGFRHNAVATDGTIEGIEHTSHPFLLGVQWHPEYSVSAVDSQLFDSFVHSAAKNAIAPLQLAA